MGIDRPAPRQVGEGDRPAERARLRQNLVHLQPCARGDGGTQRLARIDDQVLDLREHASRDIGEGVSRDASGGAEAGEIVLRGMHVAPLPVAAAEGEEVGLDQHLVEGIVPAHAPGFAVALISDRDGAVAGRERGIAHRREAHQPLGRHAAGNPVCSRKPDLGRGSGSRRRRQRSAERDGRNRAAQPGPESARNDRLHQHAFKPRRALRGGTAQSWPFEPGRLPSSRRRSERSASCPPLSPAGTARRRAPTRPRDCRTRRS